VPVRESSLYDSRLTAEHEKSWQSQPRTKILQLKLHETK